MNNIKYYRVRVKTLEELTRDDPAPPDEYVEEGDKVYQMLKKYGGCKLKVWYEESNNAFCSNKVLGDEEMEISRHYRFFYEEELIFLPETHITLDDSLFKL